MIHVNSIDGNRSRKKRDINRKEDELLGLAFSDLGPGTTPSSALPL